MKLRTKDN